MKRVIYKIFNNINDKIYIGSAEKFSSRVSQHKYHLKKNTHHNRKLQNFVNKYGIESIFFEVIYVCNDEDDLINKEQLYIDELKPFFNISKVAGSNKGLKRTPEQIQKMLETRMKNGNWYKKGFKLSEETKNKIGDAHRGKKISEEQKINHSKKMKGRKLTQEHIDKIQEGRIRNGSNKHTEETKLKLSELRKGHGNGMYGRCGDKHPNYGKKLTHTKISKRCCKILNTSNGEIYLGYKRCAEALQVSLSKVYRFLNNKTNIELNIKYYEED